MVGEGRFRQEPGAAAAGETLHISERLSLACVNHLKAVSDFKFKELQQVGATSACVPFCGLTKGNQCHTPPPPSLP